jgi:hypothetical protein
MTQMGEHRVSMLGSLRRYEDPARSSDPRIRAVVAGLSTLEVAPPARAHFRAELRSQLVAVAPRLVAEGLSAEATPVPRTLIADKPRPLPGRSRTAPAASEPHGLRAALGRIHLGKPLAIVTAVIVVFGLLLGGAVWMSRHALPGDALYGLKRASEDLELATASGPTDKAQDYLKFANTRASEVGQLLAQSGSGKVDSNTAKLVKGTLGSADSDVRQAAQLLGTTAVHNRSTKPLNILTSWAPDQVSRLAALAARVPAGTLHDRIAQSEALVRAAAARDTALAAVIGNACMKGADSDSLGPIPVSSCVPATTGPGTKPTVAPGKTTTRTGHAVAPVPPNGTTTSVGNGATGSAGGGTTTQGAGGGTSTTSGVHVTVPPLPIPSTTPISVGSCGVTVSLGPIDIGLGTCGVHAKLGS